MSTRAPFPGRPDHPDFEILAKVVSDQDRMSDTGRFGDVFTGVVDRDTALYVATQRALRIAALRGGSHAAAPDPGVATAWLDGLVAGIRFLRQKQQRDG